MLGLLKQPDCTANDLDEVNFYDVTDFVNNSGCFFMGFSTILFD